MDVESSTDAAFVAFASGSYSALLRTGCLLTGDRGLAEDLVQQCLLSTYRAWARLTDPDAAEAYTRISMVRLATRWRRQRWRGEVPTDLLPEASTDDHASGVAEAEAVRRALSALPATQRAVLVLRFFDDRSEQEVARMLRCSVGTVKSRASRALAALRAQGLLGDDEGAAGQEATAAGGPAWKGQP